MNLQRRSWLLGAGVAAAATAAGAGWALWRHRAAAPAAEAALWRMSFDTPHGPPLQMAGLLGRPVIVNFWATWCAPCIREMPALDRFQRDFAPRGWRVVGLAVDQAGPVREFLARTPVSFEIGLAASGGIELSRQLGNLAGGLPFTVMLGRSGAIVQRRIGETSYEQLAGWAAAVGH
jgi:thiol-disulfide isomerase/thioredoxin